MTRQYPKIDMVLIPVGINDLMHRLAAGTDSLLVQDSAGVIYSRWRANRAAAARSMAAIVASAAEARPGTSHPARARRRDPEGSP